MSNTPSTTAALEKNATIVDFIRIAMAVRRWKVGDLARKAGMKAEALSVELSRGVPTRRARAAIEAAFDYEERFWTDLPTLALRRRCFTQLGIDPFLTNSRALRAYALRLGINDWRANRRRALLVERVLAWVAANPNSPTKTHETTENQCC
jgi:hypothetical protein